MTPSAFIFLYENQLFLTFRDRTVAVWNFRGELVTSFEDHLLWHPDCNTNNIYITSDQDLIISYCKADSDDPLSEGNGIFFKEKNSMVVKFVISTIIVLQRFNFVVFTCGESSTVTINFKLLQTDVVMNMIFGFKNIINESMIYFFADWLRIIL